MQQDWPLHRAVIDIKSMSELTRTEYFNVRKGAPWPAIA